MSLLIVETVCTETSASREAGRATLYSSNAHAARGALVLRACDGSPGPWAQFAARVPLETYAGSPRRGVEVAHTRLAEEGKSGTRLSRVDVVAYNTGFYRAAIYNVKC